MPTERRSATNRDIATTKSPMQFGGVAYVRQLVTKRDEAKTADIAIGALDALASAAQVAQEVERT